MPDREPLVREVMRELRDAADRAAAPTRDERQLEYDLELLEQTLTRPHASHEAGRIMGRIVRNPAFDLEWRSWLMAAARKELI